VEPVEQGGATGLKGRVAGARHHGTPAREVAEQPSTKAPSTEQWSREPGREALLRRAGREGGRRRHRAEPSREAGPPRREGREGGRRRRRAEPSREAGLPEGLEGRVG
jgi:hypothetical protein